MMSPTSVVSEGLDYSDESENGETPGNGKKRRRTERPVTVSCETCESNLCECWCVIILVLMKWIRQVEESEV